MDTLEILTLILVIITAFGLFFAGFQIRLVNKQIRGEVYKTAKIKDLGFFLPYKQAYIVQGFENMQKESSEVNMGKEITLKASHNLELFVKFVIDAPQRLRVITFGFPKYNEDGNNYTGAPSISTIKTPFKAKEISNVKRDVYMDWHKHWHVEFPYSRFFAKGDAFVICLEIDTNVTGKFPLDFEIITEEAKVQYTERLWVNVID